MYRARLSLPLEEKQWRTALREYERACHCDDEGCDPDLWIRGTMKEDIPLSSLEREYPLWTRVVGFNSVFFTFALDDTPPRPGRYFFCSPLSGELLLTEPGDDPTKE